MIPIRGVDEISILRFRYKHIQVPSINLEREPFQQPMAYHTVPSITRLSTKSQRDNLIEDNDH